MSDRLQQVIDRLMPSQAALFFKTRFDWFVTVPYSAHVMTVGKDTYRWDGLEKDRHGRRLYRCLIKSAGS